MSGNGIELRTLPLQRSKSDSPRKSKSVVVKSKETSISGPKANKVVEVLTGRSSGVVIGLNKKRGKKVDENMNTTKKTEKKTGFREWFGKSAKPQKPKLSDLPNPGTMQVGPIVERLQKQSAYLHATLQEENAKGATFKKSTEDCTFHNDDFTHKRHLLQNHSRPTWCDVCEDFIWGIYRSAIRCKYCRYTCHYRCHLDIDIDCPKAPVKEKSLEDLTKETLEILSGGKRSIEDEAKITLPKNISSVSELRSLIEKYNKTSSLIMTLQDDGAFHGFVRVLMSLNRPVNINWDASDLTMRKALHRSNSRRSSRRHQSVAAVTRGASVKSSTSDIDRATLPAGFIPSDDVGDSGYDDFSSQKPRQRVIRRRSFYLPKDTKKPLHITSSTTSFEVIEALLNKYGVTDNPQKFALYERTEEEDHIRLRKMATDEHPLVLSLLWGDMRDKKAFSLQENERGDILWDAFEVPELKNFLVFLNREEEDMMAQVRKKYEDQKRILQEALDFKKQNEAESDC